NVFIPVSKGVTDDCTSEEKFNCFKKLHSGAYANLGSYSYFGDFSYFGYYSWYSYCNWFGFSI
ncbi:MAG: hypothetical protein KAW93_08185, partial [Methanogenium sp.]|nr:hypothetical protein [Methanogenium sp.]